MNHNLTLPGFRNALKLMRIPFSFFLMPVFWFALSALPAFDFTNALLVFIILHVLVYPASNGYNSYFDRDEGSIGGLKSPPKVSKELYWLVVLFDVLAVMLSLIVSWLFASMVLLYLLVSKAYSYDKIRLKKYPVLSTLVVTVFQGGFTFLMVQVGVKASSEIIMQPYNLLLALVSSLFLCGSYPLTQVYQHSEDKQRGDQTLSLMLGITGTFLFAGISMLTGATLLMLIFFLQDQQSYITIFMLFTLPVLWFFNRWFMQIRKDPAKADFENTMLMNKISSVCMSAAFITMLFFG